MSEQKITIIRMSNQFKRDLKKQYLTLISAEWTEVFSTLMQCGVLPPKYRDHQLTGNLQAYRECHIRPNLLLMYTIHDNELHLVRIGTHSELFG